MVSLQYDLVQKVVIFTATEDLDMRAIVASANDWALDPAYADDIDMMWDLRGCTWQAAVSEFFLMSEPIVGHVNEIWQGQRVALLVTTETEVALIDTHLAQVGWRAKWRGFSTETAAVEWLASDRIRTSSTA